MPIVIVHTGDGCGQYHADDIVSFQTDMHLHCDRHQFVWVSKGSRTFQCGDVVFKVEEGCTLFIPAGLAHRGLPVTASCSFKTAYVPSKYRWNATNAHLAAPDRGLPIPVR